MPVASPMTASGTPRRSRPRSRHSRLSDGARNRLQDDRGRRAAGRAGWTRTPGRRSSTQRIGSSASGSARVDAPRGSRTSASSRVLGERPDAGLLEAAQRLVQRRPERPVDGHHLAGRLHLAAERAVGARELVEREARQLDDDVVEGGLERRDGRAGHDVRDLGEPAPDGDLRRDPGDRVAGRLRGERGRARLTRGLTSMTAYSVESGESANWTLQPPSTPSARMIASAALRSRWWTGVGQRLDRRDDDRVAGVDAERVDVLHRAHRDARVVGVAHDLVLDLLPADQAALDHDLADRAGAQAGPDALAVGRPRSRRCRRPCRRA